MTAYLPNGTTKYFFRGEKNGSEEREKRIGQNGSERKTRLADKIKTGYAVCCGDFGVRGRHIDAHNEHF